MHPQPVSIGPMVPISCITAKIFLFQFGSNYNVSPICGPFFRLYPPLFNLVQSRKSVQIIENISLLRDFRCNGQRSAAAAAAAAAVPPCRLRLSWPTAFKCSIPPYLGTQSLRCDSPPPSLRSLQHVQRLRLPRNKRVPRHCVHHCQRRLAMRIHAHALQAACSHVRKSLLSMKIKP
jgi:hypothetical protein